jgi:TPR repeat protein
LADAGYGRAYFLLSELLCDSQVVENGTTNGEQYRGLALQWLHANQHLDDPEVWHDLGRFYVNEDNERAIELFEKAANAGHAASMWMLVGAFEADEDWDTALHWQIRAAEAGHVRAQLMLKMQHEHGDHLDLSDTQVFEWYVWSAEQGHVWAQLFLADAYCDRYSWLGLDSTLAIHWLTAAANQGAHQAQQRLGKTFWEGRLDSNGIEPDDEQARHWLEKAAEHGDPESQYELGWFLYERAPKIGEDSEELDDAVRLIQSAADQGYGPAQYFAARDWESFDLTAEQCMELLESAFDWHEEHAALGDPETRYDFALMHLDNWNSGYNKSCRANHFVGMDLLEEIASEPILIDADTGKPLANRTQARASRRLGVELLNPPDADVVAEAIHWLEQAADLGDGQACEKLAHLYLSGHIGVIHRLEPQPKLVEVDLQKADYWCDRAVQLGETRAAYHLGRKLLEGEHLPQNLALAEKWLLRAANAGDRFAQMQLGVKHESGMNKAQNKAMDSKAGVSLLKALCGVKPMTADDRLTLKEVKALHSQPKPKAS